jgi:hypothetical protein
LLEATQESLREHMAEIKRLKAAQPAVQEPVAWPCVISEADFEQDTITLEMKCSDYKVGAGQHWLHTTPPAQPAVPLTDEQIEGLLPDDDTPMSLGEACVKFARLVEAAHGITKGQP